MFEIPTNQQSVCYINTARTMQVKHEKNNTTMYGLFDAYATLSNLTVHASLNIFLVGNPSIHF